MWTNSNQSITNPINFHVIITLQLLNSTCQWLSVSQGMPQYQLQLRPDAIMWSQAEAGLAVCSAPWIATSQLSGRDDDTRRCDDACFRKEDYTAVWCRKEKLTRQTRLKFKVWRTTRGILSHSSDVSVLYSMKLHYTTTAKPAVLWCELSFCHPWKVLKWLNMSVQGIQWQRPESTSFLQQCLCKNNHRRWHKINYKNKVL